MSCNAYGFGSHLPLLAHAFMNTKGPVLECGGGLCSTPVLHALSQFTEPQRLVVTGDEQALWTRELGQAFANDWHIVRHVANWKIFLKNMSQDWGLVFVDNDIPGAVEHYKRRFDVMKLLPTSAVWVVHDTNDERIAKNPWWIERVAESPFVWTYEACGIETTLLAQRELPEIGERKWQRRQ